MLIGFRDLKTVRESNQAKTIVFCAGVFDLCHVGHISFLEKCRRLGDILVVMLGEDAVIKVLKGNHRPIIPLLARVKMVDSLKPVDYCLIDLISSVEDSMAFLDPVLATLRPDIYVVGPDTLDIPRRREACIKYGTRLEIQERELDKTFEPVTTSSIIEKIKNLNS